MNPWFQGAPAQTLFVTAAYVYSSVGRCTHRVTLLPFALCTVGCDVAHGALSLRTDVLTAACGYPCVARDRHNWFNYPSEAMSM